MIRSGVVVVVSDPSTVSSARRAATECAESLRLHSNTVARVALVATELATNLVKHAGGGSLVLGSDDDESGIMTLISVDKGDGMASVPAAMRDGYSTAGSPGNGLGAIERAANMLDVYSLKDRGTAILCRVSDDDRSLTAAPGVQLSVGGLCVPKHGETQPGDSWIAHRGVDALTVTVVDGLGHGPSAATAALAAIDAVKTQPDRSISELMHAAHGALRSTRGAAMGIARIRPALGTMEFVGVGNIGAAVVSDAASRRTVSIGGIVGHEMHKVQTFQYPWDESSLLVMHSDGVGTSWTLDTYPGLAARDPSLIAAVLYRDFCRGTDDATVVVAKAS